jgi:hypothetical protein
MAVKIIKVQNQVQVGKITLTRIENQYFPPSISPTRIA